MPGHQRQRRTTVSRQQVTIGHAAVPHLDHAPLETQVEQQRAAEHIHRQDAFELGIHLAQGFGQAITLGRHAVENLGQRHRTDSSGQTMPGEVAEQHMHVTGRGKRCQQQITVEQRIR
ncbi:hypothetical protein D3C79_718280 [compost metagenome]